MKEVEAKQNLQQDQLGAILTLGRIPSGRQRKGLPGIRGDGCRLHTLPAPSERWQSLDFVAVPGCQEDKDFGQESPIQDDLGT